MTAQTSSSPNRVSKLERIKKNLQRNQGKPPAGYPFPELLDNPAQAQDWLKHPATLAFLKGVSRLLKEDQYRLSSNSDTVDLFRAQGLTDRKSVV